MVDAAVIEIARAVRDAGGRALIVGGWVRDRMLGSDSKDVDIEVHGLPLAKVEALLGHFGEVIAVGRSFGVLQVKGLGFDVSLPRRDSKVGNGHRGFDVEVDPHLGFETAALRRDLTMNSMGFDPLTEELLDPHGGLADLEAKVMRATSAEHFGEDPLRGLRVAQFGARFEMRPDAPLVELCKGLDLSELPAERFRGEFQKLLVRSGRPSLGLLILRETGMLRFFPELDALIDVPQDPKWHPEGDVWVHTLMVVDQAAKLKVGDPSEDELLLLAALCHDLGKPSTTVREGDRVRATEHEAAGLPPTRTFLERIASPLATIDRVCALVLDHLAPSRFVADGSKPRAYRRLARRLGDAGVTMALLERVARADQLGRTTPEALAGTFPAGEPFLEIATELAILDSAPEDIVQGRHLIARGMRPGPEFGPLLERAREVQYHTGWTDPERILDETLSDSSALD